MRKKWTKKRFPPGCLKRAMALTLIFMLVLGTTPTSALEVTAEVTNPDGNFPAGADLDETIGGSESSTDIDESLDGETSTEGDSGDITTSGGDDGEESFGDETNSDLPDFDPINMLPLVNSLSEPLTMNSLVIDESYEVDHFYADFSDALSTLQTDETLLVAFDLPEGTHLQLPALPAQSLTISTDCAIRFISKNGEITLLNSADQRHFVFDIDADVALALSFDQVILDGGGVAGTLDVYSANGGGIGTTGADGTLMLAGAVIQNCVWPSSNSGGGLYAAGDVLVNDSEFKGNAVSFLSRGGGIYAAKTIEITDCLFEGNEARWSDSGGLFAQGDATIHSSIFRQNMSQSQGGGVRAASNILVDANSLFTYNEAAFGGGLFVAGDFLIDGSSFSYNTAFATGYNSAAGGAIFIYGANSNGTIENSHFEGNEVWGDISMHGGAIGLDSGYAGELTVTDCSFWNNLAREGYEITQSDRNSSPYKDWTFTTVSSPFSHPANNYDIYYIPSSGSSGETDPVYTLTFYLEDDPSAQYARLKLTDAAWADAFPDPPTPPASYAFSHWNTEPDDSGQEITTDSPLYPATENIKAYAVWRELKVPGPPQQFTATPGYGQVILTWTAPSTNQTAVSGYEVSKDGGANWETAEDNNGHTYPGLTNGTEYHFQVRARNSDGYGDAATEKATPKDKWEVANFQALKEAIQVFNAGDGDGMTITITNSFELIENLSITNDGDSLLLTSVGAASFTLARANHLTDSYLLEVRSNTRLTLENLILDGNQVLVSSLSGGLIFVNGGDLTVNGGTVICGSTGTSVCVDAGLITMNGGLIFGHGDNDTSLIDPVSAIPQTTGSGMILRFGGANGSIYGRGFTDDLHILSGEGSAVWARDNAAHGVYYEVDQTNSGFIPLDVTVLDALSQQVTVDGERIYGQQLTANTGALAGTLSYQWMRDKIDIEHQTGSSYTQTTADIGCTLDVRVSSDAYYGFVTSDNQQETSPAELSIESFTVADKTYDGSAAATITTVKWDGLVAGDILQPEDFEIKATFSDADAGERKDVAIESAILLKAGMMKCYNLSSASPAKTTATIVPRTVTITPDSGQSKIYGQPDPAQLTFTHDNDSLLPIAFTGQLTREGGDEAGNYPILLGDELTAGSNYTLTLADTKVDFTILKASVQSIDSVVPKVTMTAYDAYVTSGAQSAAEVLTAANLPDTLTVTTNGGAAELPVVWTTETAYDAKGTVYTVTGALTGNDNFSADNKTAGTTITVTAITVNNPEFSDETVYRGTNPTASVSNLNAGLFPTSGNLVIPQANDVLVNYTIHWDGGETLDLTTVGSSQTFTGTIRHDNLPVWLTLPSDLTVSRTIAVVEKNDVSDRIDFISGITIYTGQPQIYEAATITGFSGGQWTYTYKVDSEQATSNESFVDGKPVNAGYYVVAAVYEDDEHAGQKTVGLVIEKAVPATPAAPLLLVKGADYVSLSPPAGVTALVEYRLDEDEKWRENGTFTGLDPNTTYQFYLRLAGDENHEASAASAALSVTTDLGTLDGTLAITGETRVGSQLAVEADLSGVYELRWYRDDVTIDGATDPTYTVTREDLGMKLVVEATGNGNYTGKVTSDPFPIPAIAPEAPEVTVEGGKREITVSWTVPFDGGSSITGYQVSVDDGASWLTVDANTYDCLLTDLVPGQTYTVSVRALNRTGTGETGKNTVTLPYVATKIVIHTESGTNAITTKGGALQLIAEVQPPDMASEVVIWSVSDTAIATISDSGLLKAGTNGTVLVRATAIDESGVYGELEVTISGQGGSGGSSGGGSSTYTVTFDSNGGSSVSSQNVARNSKASEPAVPTKEGYAFSGWFRDSLLTRLYDFDDSVTSNLTLYAGWEFAETIVDDNEQEGDTANVDRTGSSSGYRSGAYVDLGTVYIAGYPGGTFQPDGTLTRAEAVRLFYNLAQDEPDWTPPEVLGEFSDVAREQWYYEAISNLSGWEIIAGYTDGTFHPDEQITRAEFITIALNFAKLMASPSTTTNFSDVPHTHWAAGYIGTAVERGLVSGYPDGSFGPERNITRAEAVTIINRLLGRDTDPERFADTENPFTDVPRSHWAWTEIMIATTIF